MFSRVAPRRLLVVIGVAAFTGVAGCSDDKGKAGTAVTSVTETVAQPTTTEATAPPVAEAEAVVKEDGFTQQGEEVLYGVVLENTSADAEALDIEVSINALDANGDALGSDDKSVSVIPPSEEFNIGGSVSVGAGERTEELDVFVKTGNSAEPEHPLPKVTRVRVERGEFGDVTIRAQVENTLDSPLSSITDVFAVARDRAGKVIGGTFTFPQNDIPPGRKRALELNFLTGLKGIASANVSVDNEITLP
jgi:hypothetical protein